MLRFSSSRIFNELLKNKVRGNFLAKISFLLSILLVVSFSLIPSEARERSARSSTAYKTESFITEIKANLNNSFDVKETINVDFTSPRHGIYRYIPVSLGEYNIKDIVVIGDMSEVDTDYNLQNKVVKIRIGDADTLIKGKKEYIIKYKIVGIKESKKAEDFLKINLFPTNWNTPIEYAKTSIVMPKYVDWADADIYYGAFASKDRLNLETNKNFNIKSDYRSLTIEAKNLPANEGLSLRKKLKNGYWVKAQNYDDKKIFMAILFVLLTLLTLLLWLLFAKEARLVKTVEFYPPEGMTPAEMGYLIDGSIEDKDILSMIVYYANKGYMNIEDMGKDAFKFTKIKDIDKKEKRFAKIFFNSIFSEGDVVTDKSMPKNLGDKYFVVKDMLEGRFIGRKRIFSKRSTMSKWFCIFLMIPMPFILFVLMAKISNKGIIIFLGAFISLMMVVWLFLASKLRNRKNSLMKNEKRIYMLATGLLLLLALGIMFGITYRYAESMIFSLVVTLSYAITAIFVVKMNARTKESSKRLGKILGFKQFIKTAELSKLKALVNKDPSYFYNILPYAYVLGLSDEWIGKFEHIDIASAKWYTSSHEDTLNTMIYLSMMDSIDHSLGSIIDKQIEDFASDCGSSGAFDGGNYSGGGFGGGGGGAW